MNIRIIIIALLLLFQKVTAQEVLQGIEPGFIHLKSGEKIVTFDIWEEKKQIIFIHSDDASFTKKKVFKKDVEDFEVPKLWEIPFNKNEEGNIEYSEVIQAEGLSKDQLYTKALSWLASMCDKLEIEDREGSIIRGTSVVEIETSYFVNKKIKFWATIEIRVKEGRYKYVINNLHAGYLDKSMIKGGFGYFPIEESAFENPKKKSLFQYKSKIIDELIFLQSSLRELQYSEEDDW